MTRTERKRNDGINDIFSTFDEEFEEMRARMDRMMEQMMSGTMIPGEESQVYGLSMHVGPDGKPRIQEFGNARAPAIPEKVPEAAPEREPLMDVIEEKDVVRVLLELPGVRKEDIEVSAEDRWLDVSVNDPQRNFARRIELPCAVKTDSAAAGYKNGVLEVTMDRAPPKRRKKKTIVE
jgi:HSP20 family protein